MYSVNESYMTALKHPEHRYKLKGTINNVSFDEDCISDLTISNRCADNDIVSIGSVYIAELNITFIKSLGIAWKSSKGWAISLEEGLWIPSLEEYQYVPIGVYYIDEITTTKEGVAVKAYDAMYKFDKKPQSLSASNRQLPSILADICTACGVTLANSSFTGFPNASTNFTLDKENDIETYRDLISWIAQTMCAYATINRSGNLELRMYKSTSTADDEIDADTMADSYVFYSYNTKYTGLYVTDREKQTSKYFAEPTDDGLTYNLGVNPFLQKLTDQKLKNACMAILDKMQNVNYMPYSIELLPSCVYDLGDIIQFSENEIGCVMLWDYTYNQSVNMQGLGQDPSLATAQSKTDKNLSGILSQLDAQKEYMYAFYNDDDELIGSTWHTILMQRFGTNTATWAMFQAEILCEALGDTSIEVRYMLDNDIIQRFPVQDVAQGKHIISLMYPITTEEGKFYNWTVQLKSDDASVSILQNDAVGIIKGQGLVSSEVWNGYIDISETYELFDTVEESELLTFTDSANIGTLTPIPNSFSESYGLLDATDDSELVDYLDVYAFNQDFHNRLTWDESAEYTWDETETFYVWGIDGI